MEAKVLKEDYFMHKQDTSNTDVMDRYVPLHRNRDYMLIVSAGTISAFGSKLSQIALPFLALAMTQAPVWAGLLGAAQLLPYLLFSLPAGVWVDHVNRKKLLVVCDILRAVLLLSIPLAYGLGRLHILHLFVVVFASGLCTLLFEITDMAALPHVVHTKQLGQARSLSEGIEATASVLGPGLGGLIIGLGRTTISGAIVAYIIDSLSYLLSALALVMIRRPLSAPQSHSATAVQVYDLRAEIQVGLCFIWQHTTLRLLMLLTSLVNFLQAPMSLFVILIAQDRFGLQAAHIGLLFGTAGIAALLGSFLAAWLYRSERLQVILQSSFLIWAVSAFIMAFAGSPLILALGLALTHFVWPLYAVAVVSYRLEQTPDDLQGRVISSFRMLSYGAEPLGLALGGLALTLFKPGMLFGAIALALLLCSIVMCWYRGAEVSG